MITKFPCYYVMGSNTDVGKTVFSAALCSAACKNNLHVDYIKPIQTGFPNDCDKDFVFQYCKSSFYTQHSLHGRQYEENLEPKTEHIFAFEKPISPHRIFNSKDKNFDQQMISELYKKIEKSSANLLLIETAGGVASPTLDGNLQCDVYRQINLPVIFIADSKLGGISTSLSSVEFILSRGFDIACILLFEGEHENAAFLTKYYENKIKVFSSFKEIEQDNILSALQFLLDYHKNKISNLNEYENIAKKHFWWPFTQHKNFEKVQIIDSALQDEFCTVNLEDTGNILSKNIYDGSASWWTQGIGHGSIPLFQAVHYAAGRFGHVMFPGNVHAPSAQLALKLIETVGKNWANRVFFSDNGSTAIEVALKMAFRKSTSKDTIEENIAQKKMIVLGLKNSYHGDTHAAMDATSPNAFKSKDRWYYPRGVWLNYPTIFMKEGSYIAQLPNEFEYLGELNFESCEVDNLFSLNRLKTPLANCYLLFIQKEFERIIEQDFEIGACILEGVIQGSGGMQFVDPLFQKILIEECKKRKIPVILDEIFTGFWRLGKISASNLLNIYPDIACYGKLLTGGLLPMAVTLATEDIFSQFLGDDKSTALLHGHSYTANPLGCAAAVAALEEINHCKNYDQKTNSLIKLWDDALVKKISYEQNVRRVFSIGSLFAFELKDEHPGYLSQRAETFIKALKEENIDARSLGNVIYILSGFNTEKQKLDSILKKVLKIV